MLVPNSFNASYGALSYGDKVGHYRGQNHLLVKSLHPDTYKRNPAFVRFMEETDVPFKPYPDEFTHADMRDRQTLYRHLCQLIWTVEAFNAHS